jgi:hypothetical protein
MPILAECAPVGAAGLVLQQLAALAEVSGAPGGPTQVRQNPNLKTPSHVNAWS